MPERPTIIDFVEKYTALYSDSTFLREKVGGVWTETSYAQTRNEGRVTAFGFMALGLGRGDKVALISEGRNQWIFTELGILYAGAVNVPLSFKLESDSDLIFRINHSESRFVVASLGQIGKIRRIIGRCPAVEKVIVLDDIDLQEGEMYVGELLEMGKRYAAEHPEALKERIASIGPDDYANISYTSGTTADPKGVLLTHRNYTANIEHCVSVVHVDPGKVMLIILPLDHCFAHVAGFYFMMRYGCSIATVPGGKNPVTMLKNIPATIREVRPHVMLSVPALSRNFKKNIESAVHQKGPGAERLYEFALRNAIAYNREYYNAGKPFWKLWWRKPLHALMDRLVFKGIRESFGGRMESFIGGGAMLDIEIQRYFCAIGMPIFQGYGLSEATPVISANDHGRARFGSCGRTAVPMDVKICDEDGRELPDGETGEILIRGENVMAGYWKNPEATARTVVDGWLHTGDRGYLCAEDRHYLYVTGRYKSLLIGADGEKYSPEGFEDSLTDSSRYVDAALLYNNQCPYTVVIIVPNRSELSAAVAKRGIDSGSEAGKRAQLGILQGEVDSYRPGGSHAGLFPEKWLPSTIIVADVPFTEQNGMLNTTSKIVRGKVEKFYASRIEYAYSSEGRPLMNPENLASI